MIYDILQIAATYAVCETYKTYETGVLKVLKVLKARATGLS